MGPSRAEAAGELAVERRVVAGLLATAAEQSEAAISRIRALLATLLIARFFLLGSHANDAYAAPRTWLVLPTGVIAVVFSAVLLHRAKRGRVSVAWLAAATVVDALSGFLSLLGDALYPGPAYPGAVNNPDTALLLVLIVAAGFRMSVPLALLGGALNTAGALSLIAVDRAVGAVPAEFGGLHLVMGGIVLVGATAIAAASARLTRRLATQAAEEAVRRDRATRDLGLVLEGHHDAQGVLSSALLNADRLEHVLRDEATQSGQLTRLARQLRDDLGVLAGCVEQVKQAADGRVTASLPLGEVDLGAAVEEALASLGEALPGLAIELQQEGPPAIAVLAGEKRGLTRILWNLLKNAHDGDGRQRARRVRLTLAPSGAQVSLVVEDDGPGFGDVPDGGRMPKPGSLGIGLTSVRNIAERSGGRLELGRSPLGGALVRVTLPARSAPI
jgi:two-component system, NtrC family, C4-dicarboxylate transport sensor histidine kinase DctB